MTTPVGFVLSRDGATTLREFCGGWLLVRQRDTVADERALFPQGMKHELVAIEIKRMVPRPFDRTDFCHALIGSLRSPAEGIPSTLSDVVWEAFADLLGVLAS